MDLVLSESFIAVANAGTISAAAQTLSVSQSALSRRMQQLERDLGVRLLVRTREGVELTAAGHEVLKTSRVLLDRYDLMRRHLTEIDSLERGLIRIGGGATATAFLLPTHIAAFHAAHPRLRFYVREAGSQATAVDVAEGRLDLGIVTTPVAVDGVDLQMLPEDQIVLVVPNEHPFTSMPVTPADIDGIDIIGFESGSAIRNLIDSHLIAAGLQVEIVAELRSISTMLNMVRDTGMPAFVSRISVQDSTDLAEVPVARLSISRHLAIATRKNVERTRATEAFIASLQRGDAINV